MALVKIRWQDALVFNIRLGNMSYYVVPYNTTLYRECVKHNSTSKEKPLEISISSDGSLLRLKTLWPKLSELESTNLGLKYIKQQYL